MESAAEALKMAAFVLIFVLTLTITITSFSEARQVSQKLIERNDKTYDYTYVENYKDSEGNLNTERIVEAESIIPTIYRAFLENYKIYFFYENGDPIPLYDKNNENINFIDLQRDDIVAFANDTQKEEFILALLYGNSYTKFNEIEDKYRTNYKIILNSKGLCDTILSEGKQYKESLGEYYQEDLKKDNEEGDLDKQEEDTTPEANKMKKRIITYTEIHIK